MQPNAVALQSKRDEGRTPLLQESLDEILYDHFVDPDICFWLCALDPAVYFHRTRCYTYPSGNRDTRSHIYVNLHCDIGTNHDVYADHGAITHNYRDTNVCVPNGDGQ